MHDLFGGVVYAGIDTDRYKYPIGSGRVTFGNLKSFMKAVKAGFVEIKTPKFSKKVCRIAYMVQQWAPVGQNSFIFRLTIILMFSSCHHKLAYEVLVMGEPAV